MTILGETTFEEIVACSAYNYFVFFVLCLCSFGCFLSVFCVDFDSDCT